MRKHKRGPKSTEIRFAGLTLSQQHPGLMLPVACIRLTKGQYAIIDPEDLELVSQYTWNVTTDLKRHCYPFYAATSIPHPNGRIKPGTQTRVRKTFRLHHLITGWPMVDHANGNGLDNRRSNLRPATVAQNMANVGRKQGNREQLSSRFKGVSWNQGKWMVTIHRGGKNVNLGRFRDEVEAARAYDAAAVACQGEFAKTNVSMGLLPPRQARGCGARAVYRLNPFTPSG